MFKMYSQIFSHSAAKKFSCAGFIARMPLPMMAIGLITMLSQLYDSYWIAGSVAASFTLSMAIVSPQLSKLVDRFGQKRVLLPSVLFSVLAASSLLVLSYFTAPLWSLYVAAVMAGAMPSIPALIRARWSALYRDASLLNTAYSFESVLDEVTFVIGPPISIALCTLLFPQAGPLFAIIFFLVGSLWLAHQVNSEPKIVLQTKSQTHSALRNPVVAVLSMSLCALGGIVGAIDILSVAIAEQQGAIISASLVLSMYALGSCIAGLAFGARNWQASKNLLFIRFSILTLVTSGALFTVYNINSLAFVMCLSGLAFALTMIVAMGMVEQHIEKARLTEGLTWLITGLGMGIAGGAALCGWLVEVYSQTSGFVLINICAAAVVGLSYALHRYLVNKVSIKED